MNPGQLTASHGQTIHYTVALFERAGDLIMVTVQAADAEPDMRAAADASSHATRQLWRTLTGALHDTRFRDGRSEQEFIAGHGHAQIGQLCADLGGPVMEQLPRIGGSRSG